MAQVALLVSSLIGLLLIGAIAVLIGRGSRDYSLSQRITGGQEESSLLERAGQSQIVWTLAFVVAAVGVSGAALVFTGVVSISEGATAAAGTAMIAVTGLFVLFYVFSGTVASARARGLGRSQAAALGSWIVGLLFVAVIALKLLGFV